MAWKSLFSVVIVYILVQCTLCKPVDRRGPPPIDPVEEGSKLEEDLGTGLEYDRYLRQVVEILESDDAFRKKLEQANISDIKSGAIASHLELVNNTIRTKLDEIKRMEVQRLHELARIKIRTMTGTQVLHYIAAHGGVDRMDIPSHLDFSNPHSFEMKDLENLIKKTTHDLEILDKKRRHDFKEYEMEKEFEYQQKLKEMPEDKRKEEETKHEELKNKHKEHEKINHPGSKDQFEEVWEKDDHLEQEFDPKTFFFMHDINGDGYLDVTEIEAILQRELDKMYDARNSPEEDDPMERFEEMNRMREHVFTEIDKDKDYMITLKEFLQYTGQHGENEKFKEDEGWEAIDDKPQFTDEELQEFIKQHHAQPGVVNVPPDHNLQFQPEDKLREQQIHMQQQQQQAFQHGVPQPPGMGVPSPGAQGVPQPPGMGVPPLGAQGVPQQNVQQQQQFNQQQFNQQAQFGQTQQHINQQGQFAQAHQQFNQQGQFAQAQQQFNQQGQFAQAQQQLNPQGQFAQAQQQLHPQGQFAQAQQQLNPQGQFGQPQQLNQQFGQPVVSVQEGGHRDVLEQQQPQPAAHNQVNQGQQVRGEGQLHGNQGQGHAAV